MINIVKYILILLLNVYINYAVKYPVWDGIRLVGTTPYEGRVDVKINGTWGTICNKGWGLTDAVVACRQLGFSGCVGTLARTEYRQGTGPIYFSSLRCRGNESRLDRCSGIDDPKLIQCSHRNDVGVKCVEPRPMKGQGTCGDLQFRCKLDNMCIPKSWRCDFHKDCTNGDDEKNCIPTTSIPIGNHYLRLVNNVNRDQNEGRLEIKVAGFWGTVCDDRFDMNAAGVACRQLGYSGAVGIKYFGPGTGQIWVDELSCIGNESSLMDCRRKSFGAHDCSHQEDVGIVCRKRKECGTQAFPVGTTRIIGGEPAIKGSWPWMASVQMILPNGQGTHLCGGTLVNRSWVMTAAHCFDTVNDRRRFLIKLGRNNIKGNESSDQTFHIARLVIHQNYKSQNHNNDIALIKLDRPANLNTDFVNTACLPSQGDRPFTNRDICYATGWGRTHDTVNPDILRQVKMPVLPDYFCHRFYQHVTSDMMCAGYLYGGKDACKGDSGGPLICKRNNHWIVGGIVSWGQGCAQVLHPGVYTRVSSYTTWIQGIITKTREPESQAVQSSTHVTYSAQKDMLYNAFGK